MKSKIFVSLLLVLSMVTPTLAYEEIECNIDTTFAEHSCNQCFKGESVSQGDPIGFLSDDWINSSSNDMILYKEIQEDPRFINLSPDTSWWDQQPSSQDFWEYTSEFENIYSESEDGYVLESGKKVTWIKSKLGYSYELDLNTAPLDENIGMLIFPITTHALLDDGTISEDADVHNECVLYTSWDEKEAAPLVVKRLPETGPAEFVMLGFLAMLIWFVFIKNRKES